MMSSLSPSFSNPEVLETLLIFCNKDFYSSLEELEEQRETPDEIILVRKTHSVDTISGHFLYLEVYGLKWPPKEVMLMYFKGQAIEIFENGTACILLEESEEENTEEKKKCVINCY